jgi:carboxypeptidase PM20D1
MLCKATTSSKITKTTERSLNADKIAEHLSSSLQFQTISMVGDYLDKSKPFFDFQEYLQNTYPIISKVAERTIINKFSIVYKFSGSDSLQKPGAFLAHQDVVPAPSEGWDFKPFSGNISGEYIYGRGAQDMKGTLISLMEAMEALLAGGFKPMRDLYFCFGHDEEPMHSQRAQPKL